MGCIKISDHDCIRGLVINLPIIPSACNCNRSLLFLNSFAMLIAHVN